VISIVGGSHSWQWVAAITALLTVIVMLESWLGHFRSGFPLRAQYAPLVVGAVLTVACVSLALAPGVAWTRSAARWAGWSAIFTGAVGVGYHHYYGILQKAGGYRWLLHYLMYGAPQLAPFALSAAGALAVVTSSAATINEPSDATAASRLTLAVVAVAISGAAVQTGILHYRGAFNTPLMYAPLLLPPLAALGSGWLAVSPATQITTVVRVMLWGTFLLGFVGLGMHLRGLDRQMGGLHLFLPNLLQGPPPLAPAVYATVASVGLLVLGAW
jgi:hypothetical protein